MYCRMFQLLSIWHSVGRKYNRLFFGVAQSESLFVFPITMASPFVYVPWSFFVYRANAHQSTHQLRNAVDSGLEGGGKLLPGMRSFAHGNKNLPKELCAAILDFSWHSLRPKPLRLVGNSFWLHSAAAQDTTKLVAGGPIHPHPSPSNFLSCNLCSTIWFTTFHLPLSQQWETRFSYPLKVEMRGSTK